MPFDTGRVSFCRYRVGGDAPPAVTEEILEKLGEFGFIDSAERIGAPEEVEAGWITGEHLFDTGFTYAKNGFADMLLFALRIDTNKVPGDVKKAYRTIYEKSAAAENPSGFPTKAQKKEAKEAAEQKVQEEMASGKYTRSKAVPLLWDLSGSTLYVGGSGNTVLELVATKFRETFGLELTHLSAGTLAQEWAEASGLSRDLEDALPSPFSPPPKQAGARSDDEEEDAVSLPTDITIPEVPWAKASLHPKDFLGNEMLVWLWWCCETTEGLIEVPTDTGPKELALVIDRSLEMDCAWGVSGKQTLKGEAPTQLAEAAKALCGGKWPRKAGIMLNDGELQWEFGWQTDKMIVSGAALPEPDEDDKPENPRDQVELRLNQTRGLSNLLDRLLAAFLKIRFSDAWPTRREQVTEWIHRKQQAMVAS
jgi:hypothetical protein